MLGHADANLLVITYGHSFDKATVGVGDWLASARAAAQEWTTVVPLSKASG